MRLYSGSRAAISEYISSRSRSSSQMSGLAARSSESLSSPTLTEKSDS
ncbi:MAG: hypothetical protein LUH56_06305 [Oscillospiraceae bacterium]|nr:hypothetical protein [Oscillospiraceae bacterium]